MIFKKIKENYLIKNLMLSKENEMLKKDIAEKILEFEKYIKENSEAELVKKLQVEREKANNYKEDGLKIKTKREELKKTCIEKDKTIFDLTKRVRELEERTSE